MVALFAVAAALSGCSGGGFNTTPAAQIQPTGIQARPGILQSQFECVTDDGYGRSRPCGDAN
jgi:hypothetical protein